MNATSDSRKRSMADDYYNQLGVARGASEVVLR